MSTKDLGMDLHTLTEITLDIGRYDMANIVCPEILWTMEILYSLTVE